MDTLLANIASPDNLSRAFRLCARSPGMWSPSLPMDRMRFRPEWHLLRLHADLLEGSYAPAPAHLLTLQAADGRERTLTIFKVRDRVVQRALAQALQPVGERLFLDSSYAYRPGLSAEMAICRVREWIRSGRSWIVRTDIERCFDRLPRQHALALLDAACGSPTPARLLREWFAVVPGQAQGIPTGMATSPFVANLCLHGLDLRMRREKRAYVRYGDDLVVVGHDRSEAAHALASITQHLARLGMSVNAAKTVVAASSPALRFLGRRLPGNWWRTSAVACRAHPAEVTHAH